MVLSVGFGQTVEHDSKVDDLSQILRYELPDNSSISAIEFNYNVSQSHGAPCSVTVEPGDIDHTRFWNKMQAVVTDLNMVPPHIELMPSELKSAPDWRYQGPDGKAVDFGGKQYPNFRGNHTLAGGDNGHVDRIAAQDAIPMIRKMLHGLSEDSHISHSKPIITTEQAEAAFQDLVGQVQSIHEESRLDSTHDRDGAAHDQLSDDGISL